MTKIVLCEENEYLFAVALPDNEDDCERGPVLGPPEGLRKSVHNKLAELGIYNAFDLMGKHALVLKVLKDLAIDVSYARTIKHIYQMQYFSSKEDEE